jgi:hypothetical protein
LVSAHFGGHPQLRRSVTGVAEGRAVAPSSCHRICDALAPFGVEFNATRLGWSRLCGPSGQRRRLAQLEASDLAGGFRQIVEEGKQTNTGI